MSGCGRSSSSGSRFPFTTTQWQELEHQALVFKYMVSGVPVPPDLLFTIRRSLDSSLSSKFLIHQPQHIGWNSFHMGFGRKIDPEPGRCRRTDGKKWRCSKEAYPDSKYCERHMHRGRNRSRKPVEILSQTTATATAPNAIPINNNIITNKNTQIISPSSPVSYQPSEPHFLYPHFSSSRPPGIGLSSQENTTNFFLEPNAPRAPAKDCRNSSYGHGMKGDTDEHAFFSEANSNSGGSFDYSWKLAPLTMGSSSLPQMKNNANYSSDFQNGQKIQSLNSQQKHHDHYYYSTCDMALNLERDDQPKKVMHHFLDEWPPRDKDSWLTSEDKTPTHKGTQLSISTPNSLHDFFMTPK
ncbi:UNVERIFIED_CONTAM: Growth-regulating factor 1, partial [Sesamum radiatum]